MENISTIKDRILTFLESEGIKKADFYSTTGISDSNFKGKNLSSQLGGDAIVKVLTSYPNLSADWLLVGRGDMLKQDSNSIQTKLEPEDTKGETAIPVPDGCHEGIPLVPLSAMAGAFTNETSVMEYECERYVIPAFKGADFLIQIKGDSMHLLTTQATLLRASECHLTTYSSNGTKLMSSIPSKDRLSSASCPDPMQTMC